MGLAASQARFLGITARKSNIEYEGQQVNQQRTALAQEVNALYSKLLALETPIAPDTTKFYETNYSFELTNSSDADGEYLIKSYYPNADNETYTVNTLRTYEKQVAVGQVLKSANNEITYNETTQKYSISGIKDVSIEMTELSAEESAAMIGMINEAYPNKKIQGDHLFTYRDSAGITYYIDSDVVTGKIPEEYSVYSKTNKEFTNEERFETAKITFDENNRMETISLDGETILEVGTTRVHNSEKFDAALRDYTMSKDEYDKMVADLNAQTEILQQEDKVLELRLNQIDTEQNELQTELEAVKKILEKNIENTFKTFA